MAIETAPPYLVQLAKAQDHKQGRARVRMAIKAMDRSDGVLAVATLLEIPPPECGSATVGAVMCWPRKCKRAQMLRWLLRADVWRQIEGVRLDQLTPREAASLAAVLRADA